MSALLSDAMATPSEPDAADDFEQLSDWSRVGRLERLPKWMNLIPMVAQWLLLSLRYRSATLPSSANPAITAGGLVGDGKIEYFDIMGPHALAATATATSILNPGPATGVAAAEDAMRRAGLEYPVIAKPDLGWCGHGVRLVRNDGELASYLSAYPQHERVVLQHFVPYEGEAGVFYIRRPGEACGRLIGILLRSYPRVTGDGKHSIAALIAGDPRLSKLGRDGRSEPCCDTSRVPAQGEVVRLSTIGSTRVGGMYRDATSLVTAAMTQAFDRIAKDMKDFHVGRFDVRYQSLIELREGRGFVIVEVNGAGSEAVHAWEPRLTLREAYHIVFEKQRAIFALGDVMRRRGHKPVSALTLTRLFLRQEKLIRCYPPSN